MHAAIAVGLAVRPIAARSGAKTTVWLVQLAWTQELERSHEAENALMLPPTQELSQPHDESHLRK